jgi:voltage-gated potassium channel
MIQKIWNSALMILALLFLWAFSYPAFTNEVSKSTQSKLEIVQWIVWFVFAIDFIANFWKSRDRSKFFKSHVLDFLAIFLPFLRPLRLLRLLSFGSLVLSKISVGKSIGISIKVALTSFFLAFISAVQITIIERPLAGSNIKSFEDGFWWAITTVTTVGYGDRFPTSTEGRLIAFCLMLLGISLLGVLTASVAAWFVQMSQDEAKNN